MIPKILDATIPLVELVNDTTEGLGRLPEATVVTVTEERNGAYYAELTVPISAKHYKDLTLGGIITAKPNTTDNPQMFRIAKMTRPMNGLVQIRANHISYDLNKTSVKPFGGATNVATALYGIKNQMQGGEAFSFYTDKTTAGRFSNTIPQSARALMGGQQGSLLDVYGGEYQYNGLQIRLMNNRGSDRGVRIAYGKNLTDIKQEENIESMYTAVMPYVMFSNMTQAKVGDLQTIIQTAEPKIMNLDLTSKFKEEDGVPTAEQINAAAQSYIEANTLTEPKISISVSFVNLADTEEYKNIAPLERVSLCDTVSVFFEKLNINAKAKVVKVVYDVLAERYKSIELGNARTTLASTITNAISTSQQSIRNTRSFLEDAIAHATELITGGLGGHVIFNKNAAGEPEEILIMDTDSTETAVNVIRMNMGGIGFSRSGYNGPFVSAWDIDGNFNADFIRSGSIEAVNITGSNITGSEITGSNMQSDNGSMHMKMWAGIMSLLHDQYMRASLYTSAGEPGASQGILRLFSGTSTDANTVPPDGFGAYLYPRGLQIIDGSDETCGFSLREDNGSVYLGNKKGMYVKISDTALTLHTSDGEIGISPSSVRMVNSNTNTSISLDTNNGLSIFINGSGYTNLGFVSDGQGHAVLGR